MNGLRPLSRTSKEYRITSYIQQDAKLARLINSNSRTRDLLFQLTVSLSVRIVYTDCRMCLWNSNNDMNQ